MLNPKTYILTASCDTRSGIVAQVTQFLAQRGCYLSETAQFDDAASQRFFMRIRFDIGTTDITVEGLRQEFNAVADQYSMEWGINAIDEKVRTIIMVSRFDHCLEDIFYRLGKGDLNMDVVAVVSNHLDLQARIEAMGLPYVHLPINPDNKAQQEKILLQLFIQEKAELIVLARYMQVLSDDFCTQLLGQVINIHHSFLPGFKGAKPYHQAHARGVKLIGATAHYVTPDLDEGPIISQTVQPVDHTHTPEQLVAIGRDSETQALANALKLHCEHRVFLDGNRTVIFK